MTAVMAERSPSPNPRSSPQEPVLEQRAWASEPDQDFCSETMSELGSEEPLEDANSGASRLDFITIS